MSIITITLPGRSGILIIMAPPDHPTTYYPQEHTSEDWEGHRELLTQLY